MKKISKYLAFPLLLFTILFSACGTAPANAYDPTTSQNHGGDYTSGNSPTVQQPMAANPSVIVESQPFVQTNGLNELTVEEIQYLIGKPEPFNDFDAAQTEIQLPEEVNLVTNQGTYSICKLSFDVIKSAYSIGITCAGLQIDLGNMMPIIVMNLIYQGSMSTIFVPEGLIASGSTVSLSQIGTGTILFAAVATGVTAATSEAIQAAPCIPQESYQMFLAASDPASPKPRICTEKATFEELPKACTDHHVNHDDTPDHPDAQARWQTASNASKADNWGANTQNWDSQQTQPGEWRCSQTEVNVNGNWKVVRFATSVSTKITPTNAYGDMTIVDVFSNQITSFPLARWRDLIKSANDLVTSYGTENVRTYPINCYDLRQYGVTIKSSLNGDQPTRPNQAAVCTNQP